MSIGGLSLNHQSWAVVAYCFINIRWRITILCESHVFFKKAAINLDCIILNIKKVHQNFVVWSSKFQHTMFRFFWKQPCIWSFQMFFSKNPASEASSVFSKKNIWKLQMQGCWPSIFLLRPSPVWDERRCNVPVKIFALRLPRFELESSIRVQVNWLIQFTMEAPRGNLANASTAQHSRSRADSPGPLVSHDPQVRPRTFHTAREIL
jgi:hypothetical protein